MENQALLKEINKIFIEVLDNDTIELREETTADDIEEWDSLNHVRLIIAVEKHFTIKFTSSEIRSFNNVGDMCETITAKVG